MKFRNPFAKTSYGTLQCPACTNTAIKLIEKLGWNGTYYISRWRCKKCNQTFRYEQVPKPENLYNDPDKFKATFNPYQSFKRGLNIIHPKLEI